MWNQERSPKTPILYHHWISEGQFTFSPVSFRHDSSATLPVHLLSEDFHSPLSNGDQSFVIIPLHTPPKKVTETGKQAPETDARSSQSPMLARPENGTQAHCRSPAKRFHSPGPICRICHEGDSIEKLLSPCSCSGSLQLVHKSCLEKWLSTSNSDHCEICMVPLPIRREARPLWQWFAMTDSNYGPQGFYADLTCVILLTPLCLLSVYLCAIGAADYMRHGIWEGTGLATLSFFLLCTYLVWCYITVRFHWKTAMKWRSANQVIHLIEKDFHRKDQPCSQVAGNVSPRTSLISSNEWHTPPGVHIAPPRSHMELYESNNRRNQIQNPLDASLQNFDVPAFL